MLLKLDPSLCQDHHFIPSHRVFCFSSKTVSKLFIFVCSPMNPSLSAMKGPPGHPHPFFRPFLFQTFFRFTHFYAKTTSHKDKPSQERHFLKRRSSSSYFCLDGTLTRTTSHLGPFWLIIRVRILSDNLLFGVLY